MPAVEDVKESTPAPAPEAEAFVEAEPEATEREHFEILERETTQPVRRYFEPRHVHDISPADVAHAVDFEVPTEAVTAPESAPAEPPLAFPESAADPLEPWPDPLQTTQSVWSEPAHVEPIAEEPIAPPASIDEARFPREHLDAPTDFEPAPPQHDDDTAAYEDAEQRASTRAFEPLPFAVPPPGVYRSPAPPEPAAPEPLPVAQAQVDFEPPYVEPAPPPPTEVEPEPAAPVRYEATYVEPVAPALTDVEPQPAAPVRYEPPYVAPPRREVEWKPQPAPVPPPTLRHDVAAAWSPSPAIRREPSFHPAAYVEPSPAAPAFEAKAAPTPRDSRDLFRRAVRVAVLVFCGWFVAVLLLIAAFRFINPPFSMLMALQFMTGTPINKQWVPIERISPNLTRAVIVAEDGRFCQHWGIDFIEAANAIRRASDGYPRGASTITMQVAKNLFLLPAKSYLRKVVEIPLTLAIELAWPKWRILEVYLNIVEWGPGIFGAEAASRAHFGRPAMGLSSRQAAQLAVSLPNPIKRDAGSPGPRTAQRASVIQARAARTREASECVDGGG